MNGHHTYTLAYSNVMFTCGSSNPSQRSPQQVPSQQQQQQQQQQHLQLFCNLSLGEEGERYQQTSSTPR